jgi:hypothetical protein
MKGLDGVRVGAGSIMMGGPESRVEDIMNVGEYVEEIDESPTCGGGRWSQWTATAFPLFPLPPILLLMRSSPDGCAFASPSIPQTQQTRTGYTSQACPSFFHGPRRISDGSRLPLPYSLSSSASLLRGLSSSPRFADKRMSQMRSIVRQFELG